MYKVSYNNIWGHFIQYAPAYPYLMDDTLLVYNDTREQALVISYPRLLAGTGMRQSKY